MPIRLIIVFLQSPNLFRNATVSNLIAKVDFPNVPVVRISINP